MSALIDPPLTGAAGRTALGFTNAIIQTVWAVKKDTASVTPLSQVWASTGFTCAITPSSATSTIRATIMGQVGLAVTWACAFRITRGGTLLSVTGESDAASNRIRSMKTLIGVANGVAKDLDLLGLDVPGVTTPVTYQLEWQMEVGSTAYLNRSVTDPNTVEGPRGICVLTLEEIL